VFHNERRGDLYMAISRDIITTKADLFTWLTTNLVPTYFNDISYDTNDPNLINFTSLDGNIIFTLSQHSSSEGRYTAANLYSNGVSSTVCSYSTGAFIQYASICNNGAIIRFSSISQGNDTSNNSSSSVYHMSLLFTKNNHNKTMIIAGYSGNSSPYTALRTDVHCVSDGDDLSTESKLTFTNRDNMQQTQLVPFVSSRLSNDVVYSPNAYYIQTGNMYTPNYFIFEMNGVKYMSNGYWAIKD
jgi:hypothetical protein